MSALDDCHALAAVLWPNHCVEVTTREAQPAGPDRAQVYAASTRGAGVHDSTMEGATPDAAVAALTALLAAGARARAAALLAAAGEPQPAGGGVRRGARLSDDALRHVALDVLRAEGVTAASTLRRVAVAIVDAIRQAERRADESDERGELGAEGVARDLIGPSMARLDASAAPLRAAAGGDE